MKLYRLGTLAIVTLLALSTVHADNIHVTDITTTAPNVLEISTGLAGGTAGYYVGATGNTCDAADGSPLTVTIVAPAGVTASPGSLQFTACGSANTQDVTFTSSTPGDRLVTVSTSDTSGSYNPNPAAFTLRVTLSDTTPPVVTPLVNGLAPIAGWYTTDAALTWSITDGESATTIVSGCAAETITTDTTGVVRSCTVSSAGGTTGPVSVTIRRDATAPLVGAPGVSPAANADGWNQGPVTVSWDCSDATSGAVSPTVQDVVAGPGVGLVASADCADVAGNTAPASLGGLKIDLEDPVTTLQSVTPPNTYGWNNGPVWIVWDCADALSGPITPTVPGVITDQGTNLWLNGQCMDYAQRTSIHTVTGINVDWTAPLVVASRAPAANGLGWNNEDVTVSFDCTDALSGVWIPAPDVVLAEGAGQSAFGSCTDYAGNAGGDMIFGINVDKTAPDLSVAASPFPNLNGWRNADTLVSFDCTDTLSGVLTVSANVLLGEGAGQTADGSCEDRAGNVVAISYTPVNVDKTKPSVAATGFANGGNYVFGSAPIVGCEASDALSGLAGACSINDLGGAVGLHTVTVSATDLAGNVETVVSTYTIDPWTLSGFFSPVALDKTVKNTVKAGSTVPLKFRVFAGTVEITNPAQVTMSAVLVSCSTAPGAEDPVDYTTTGSTALRYDASAQQFITNWKTPSTKNVCIKVTATSGGGSTYAIFQTK